jgi:uncharacterized protein YkwD
MRFAVVIISGAVACAGRQGQAPGAFTEPQPEPAPITELEPAEHLAQLAAPADIERSLAAIINQQRAAVRRSLLRSDPVIAESARRHSELVRDDGARRERQVESPAQRLRAAGVVPVALSESFLEVDSVATAATVLVHDPVLRANLESATATHVGLGVAVDDTRHRLFITITYVQFPPRIDAAAVARRVANAVAAVEHSHIDARLSDVAQHCATRLAAGAQRADVWPEIKRELDSAAGRRFAKIADAMFALVDVEHVDVAELIHDRAADDIGIGVSQSERHGLQGGVTWVVVFLAQRLAPRLSATYH